ncbi:CDP-alcohol phosphatidyltransferase family protein [Aeromicrobium sp.]|uniref:CDP-alcohol phosphatidyltransferase family protein n=1 Tax=Aeromicrobium sp. TaxID=1871063 RepID=UPI0019B2A106|nr:CDP-alcohol phosphatidyltransferase family protein [Aeromicrobium sp.]MBC7632278.1 CDP-alcohol phosphatidyltransferase family protein [Aeromicrobium sp.]
MSSFQEALAALAGAQKSKKGVSLYSRFVNRPIGRVIAAGAYRAGLSPNGVSAVSALLTAAGLVLLVLATPSLVTGIGVALLLVLGFAFDSADGQVARLTGRSSPAGEWLDHVIDAGKMVLLHSAVLVALWRHVEVGDGWLLVPLAYQAVAVVMFSALTIVELLSRTLPTTEGPPPSPSTPRALALLPADYGVLALSFVLWGAPTAFFGVYTVLLALNALILAGFLIKWFRALDAYSSLKPGILDR